MPKVKTSELQGAALDWAVAKCEGTLGYYVQPNEKRGTTKWEVLPSTRRYSTNWAQGGPIIEREGITVSKEDGCWSSYFRDHLFDEDGSEHWSTGDTPISAAMRCFVSSKLGGVVEIPEELC